MASPMAAATSVTPRVGAYSATNPTLLPASGYSGYNASYNAASGGYAQSASLLDKVNDTLFNTSAANKSVPSTATVTKSDLSDGVTDTVVDKDTIVTASGKTCKTPWKEPFRCPLIIYIVLVILGVIFNLIIISRIPTVDRDGVPISGSRKWVVGTIAIIINLLVAFLFGWWMYSLCAGCNFVGSWLVFLLAIFFPIILALITAALITFFLGVGFLALS